MSAESNAERILIPGNSESSNLKNGHNPDSPPSVEQLILAEKMTRAAEWGKICEKCALEAWKNPDLLTNEQKKELRDYYQTAREVVLSELRPNYSADEVDEAYFSLISVTHDAETGLPVLEINRDLVQVLTIVDRVFEIDLQIGLNHLLQQHFLDKFGIRALIMSALNIAKELYQPSISLADYPAIKIPNVWVGPFAQFDALFVPQEYLEHATNPQELLLGETPVPYQVVEIKTVFYPPFSSRGQHPRLGTIPSRYRLEMYEKFANLVIQLALQQNIIFNWPTEVQFLFFRGAQPPARTSILFDFFFFENWLKHLEKVYNHPGVNQGKIATLQDLLETAQEKASKRKESRWKKRERSGEGVEPPTGRQERLIP